MSSHMLSIPFRRTHRINLSSALKKYISSQYDQHPEMFTEDLLIIDRLRQAAVDVQQPHISGISNLLAYMAQLKWIGGKFPLDVGIEFAWYPALGFNTDTPVIRDNLRFELVNILFNLAALYSQLATSLAGASPTNIRTACKYYCFCAGVLQHLRVDVIPDLRDAPPEDMDDSTLESLQEVMLAQAQECFWHKAVNDEIRDAAISRLAAKVAELYSSAGESATKSNGIGTEWMHHMTAKSYHFAAAAQFRQSLDCLEKRRYGEEVARLRESLSSINEGLKESKWVRKVLVADMNGLKTRVAQDLTRSEKDNDIIYLDIVPPKSQLKEIDAASMVAAKAPPEVTDPVSLIGNKAPLGEPLFAKLVPYAVHIAHNIYTDRRDRLVNQDLIPKVAAMTMKLKDILQSLNLPGSLEAMEKPLGLPQSLISHAEEVRQQDGLNRLYESLQETSKLRARDQTTFKEAIETLKAEEKEDQSARMKHGTDRWHREPSNVAGKKLFAQIAEFQGYLKAAADSDQLIEAKMRESDDKIRILTCSTRELENYVPSGRRLVLTPEVVKESSRLRTCLNEVNRCELRRKRWIDNLKEKAKKDNIHSTLVKEASRLERESFMQQIEPVQFEPIFETCLQSYDTERQSLEEEARLQDELVERLETANAAFNDARKTLNSAGNQQRERILQGLENGYIKYKEIIVNIETGRKFYNDLAKLAGKYREDCKRFVQSRRAEAVDLEREIVDSDALASLKLSSGVKQQTSNPSARISHEQQLDAPPASATPVRPPSGTTPVIPSKSRSSSIPRLPRPPSFLVPATPAQNPATVPASNPNSVNVVSNSAGRGTVPPPPAETGRVAPPSTTKPIPAPVTPGTWTKGMPIRFGGPPSFSKNMQSSPTNEDDKGGTEVGSNTAGKENHDATANPQGKKVTTGTPGQRRVWHPEHGMRFG